MYGPFQLGRLIRVLYHVLGLKVCYARIDVGIKSVPSMNIPLDTVQNRVLRCGKRSAEKSALLDRVTKRVGIDGCNQRRTCNGMSQPPKIRACGA